MLNIDLVSFPFCKGLSTIHPGIFAAHRAGKVVWLCTVHDSRPSVLLRKGKEGRPTAVWYF